MGKELEVKGQKVKDVFERKNVPVEGLYLKLNLKVLAEKNNGRLVISNYVTDLDDVIATRDENGEFQVAKELKNLSDWRLFNELSAQADILFTGREYLKRVEKLGEKAQNVLNPFDRDGKFSRLGVWRLKHGYENRNPDMAILSRSLDFEVPGVLTEKGRKVYIFTTYEMSKSERAKELEKEGVKVVGAGEDGVDGLEMVHHLQFSGNYKIMKNTTGPRVFDILLKSGTLDMIFITQVQKEISYSDQKDVQKVLLSGGKVSDLPEFQIYKKFRQKGVFTDTGDSIAQEFQIFVSEKLRQNLEKS